MNLVTGIENWVVNVIRNSPKIPKEIFIRSLADSADQEEMVQHVSNISVAYKSSNNRRVNLIPLVTEKTLNFEITYIFQSHLSTGAHSLATEVLREVEKLLSGRAPMRTGTRHSSNCRVNILNLFDDLLIPVSSLLSQCWKQFICHSPKIGWRSIK